MRVLMLGWELPPYNSGGLGTACYQMCKELAENGVGIEFILPYEADHNIDFMKVTPALNIKPEDMHFKMAYDSANFTNDHSDLLDNLFSLNYGYEKNIEHIVKIADFDVIHAHDWLTFKAAMKAKKISGKPLVVHVHATEYDRSAGMGGNSLVEEIEYSAMSVADKIITVSNYTKEIVMKKYRIPADKIEVVHNSIDIEAYSKDTGINLYHYLMTMRQNGWKVISNIGRLTVQKGLVNLLRAFRKVIDEVPNVILMIVGSGDQLEELIELSSDLKLSRNVIFVDFQRGQGQRDAFMASDLFVMPSVSEPFGITPLESIGFGTPVLISNQSGVSEIINHALKVDYWDVDEMANQLISAMRHQSLLDDLKRESTNEFMNLNWKKSAKKLHTIYDSYVGVAA